MAGVASLAAVFVLVAGNLPVLATDGLGRFHLGHHHARERTHAYAEASSVDWTSVLTADQHARALGYMVGTGALVSPESSKICHRHHLADCSETEPSFAPRPAGY